MALLGLCDRAAGARLALAFTHTGKTTSEIARPMAGREALSGILRFAHLLSHGGVPVQPRGDVDLELVVKLLQAIGDLRD
jgi:hypothetical protein